jgi:hypothetical protein
MSPALRLRKVTTQGLSPLHFQLQFTLQTQIFFSYVLFLINISLHFFCIWKTEYKSQVLQHQIYHLAAVQIQNITDHNRRAMYSQLSIYYEYKEVMELECNIYNGNWGIQEADLGEWKLHKTQTSKVVRRYPPFQAVVFWVITTSCLVGGYQCFERMYLGLDIPKTGDTRQRSG